MPITKEISGWIVDNEHSMIRATGQLRNAIREASYQAGRKDHSFGSAEAALDAAARALYSLTRAAADREDGRQPESARSE